MPPAVMLHEKEPRDVLKEAVGDIENVEIFRNQVLVAIYIPPEKTRGGILMPGSTRDENKFQGKIGLVLKNGPLAFVDPEGKWFAGVKIEIDDWVVFRPSDGWALTVNGHVCRVIDDTDIRGRVDHPDKVW